MTWTPHGRITLDGQLVGYWDREAARLDAMAALARFGWQRRRLARKAALARAKAELSRGREAARGNAPGAEAAPAEGPGVGSADGDRAGSGSA